MLDERLGLIAEMAGSGGGIADIGCDHGYLVCELVADGRAKLGLACDIAPGPLCSARAEVSRRGLQDRVTCLLTDGLSGVAPDGLDRIVIAGMGGELIAEIIGGWQHRRTSGIRWLLQPMTRAEQLRGWLFANGFCIEEERCCVASGKPYSVMLARYTGAVTLPDAKALWFGRTDPERDPHAAAYRGKVLSTLEKRLNGLRAAAAPDAATIAELAGLVSLLREQRSEK